MKNILNFFLPQYVVDQQNQPKKTETNNPVDNIYIFGTLLTSFIIVLICVGIPLALCKYVNLF